MPKPFVDAFIDFNKDAESPESFFRWAAYATVAAALKDNVYVDLGKSVVFPNIYVILMARSAALRKGMPLRKAGDLLRELKVTRLLSGRTSIQAVINELGHFETDGKSGKLNTTSSAILMSEELSSFMTEDKDTIPILTDLYDNHPNWTNNLVGRGKTELKNTCVTMLAASNEILFREVYTATAIRGGLLGRTFIVRESKKKCINSLMYIEIEDDQEWLDAMRKKHDNSHLKESLQAISGFRGPVILEHPARVEYHKWYHELQKQIENNENDPGVVDRVHTGILKVGLAIAVGNDFELRIKKEHIEEAIFRCTALLKNYEVLTMGSGKSQTAEPAAILLAYLFEKGGKEKRRNVLRSNWQHFDSETLDTKLVPTLEQAGILRTIISADESWLELTDHGMGLFKK
jgi:hypothetical protein